MPWLCRVLCKPSCGDSRHFQYALGSEYTAVLDVFGVYICHSYTELIKCPILDIWLGSEYTSISEYNNVLNIY